MRDDDHNPAVVDLGLYPETAVDLVNENARAERRGLGPDHATLQGLRIRETLEFLCGRAAESCENDASPESLSRNPGAARLWSLTDDLMRITGEVLPAEEAELAEALRTGPVRPETAAERIAAEWRGRVERIAEMVLEVGVLAGELGLRPHRADIERGRKTVESARAGHEAVHGTQGEKAARWAEYQEHGDEIRRRSPTLSERAIRVLVADHFGVSESTIKRHTSFSRARKED